ncbi:MAG: hypothetical protein MJ252_01030 [archaeon]|nr:hypothetical protein [archaeon]
MSLISLSLNKIEKAKEYFSECLQIFTAQKTIEEKRIVLNELIYNFFRVESLSNFYKINQEAFENNKKEKSTENQEAIMGKLNEFLFYLHKTLKENNVEYWYNFLKKEIKARETQKESEINDSLFLFINEMAAEYCCRQENEDKTIATNKLVEFYKKIYNKKVTFNSKDINESFENFKNRIVVAADIYKNLIEKEFGLNAKMENLETEEEGNKINIIEEKAKGNKILIKILLRHALNFFSNEEENQTKKNIELILEQIENNEINFSNINILDIKCGITRSLKQLIKNLIIIKKKLILLEYFPKFKAKTLGYTEMSEFMKKQYKLVNKFLEANIVNLSKGQRITKYNYTSDGLKHRFYKIEDFDNDYNLYIAQDQNKMMEKNYMKTIGLKEIINVTNGCYTDNIKKKIWRKKITNFYPWLFLSLHLNNRTIDLYFDDDESVNKWFLGIYYYKRYFEKAVHSPKINHYFFNKLKLKLLYKIKEMNVNLPIIDKIKRFAEENEIEYQSLPFQKVLVLYMKINQKIEEMKKGS